jgi:hypothetical protein
MPFKRIYGLAKIKNYQKKNFTSEMLEGMTWDTRVYT